MADIPLSLIDRLLDDEPDSRIDPAETEDRLIDRYKLGLRRDLEGLLNSRRPELAGVVDGDPLAKTILTFGLPDISTEDFATPVVRERVRRMIADTIRTHEPRLTEVEVEVDGAPTSRGIRFRIHAVLSLARMREEVVYDASVRPSDRAIAVELPD